MKQEFLKVKMYNHNSIKNGIQDQEMIIEFLFDYFKTR